MGTVLAGEAGSVLAAAAVAEDPPVALALEGLARPTVVGGVPAWPADALGAPGEASRVLLHDPAPSTHSSVRAWAEEHGLEIADGAPPRIEPPEGVRVVAISALATGTGKTPLVRRVARGLRRSVAGLAALRSPIANLACWDGWDGARVLRGADDLLTAMPLEAEDEIAPVLGTGVPVVAGLDPRELLRAAAEEARDGVIVWDGGGGGRPWLRPDLSILAIDLLRPLPEGARGRVQEAGALVLTKSDSAPEDRAREIEAAVRGWNPSAPVLLMDLPPAVPSGPEVLGRRVVVVEDWHSLVLGGLKAGAGAVAAKRFRCGVVDPRPFASGSVAEILSRHPHIGPVIPALGRTPEEIQHLRASIEATPGDAVLWAAPASPDRVLEPGERPIHRVFAELMEVAGGSLGDLFADLSPGA